MTKVYCSGCRWFRDGRGVETKIGFRWVPPKCKNVNASTRSTWYSPIDGVLAPSEINANNDCKWFEAKGKEG